MLDYFLGFMDLVLETVNVFLMIIFKLGKLVLVHLVEFILKGLFLSFKESLILNQFGPDIVIFLFENVNRLFIMGFLFNNFIIQLIVFLISLS